MTHTKMLGALLTGAALILTTPAFADADKVKSGKEWSEIKKLSPEERKKFHEERKAKWDALSKEEKLKMIEERRAKRLKEMDDHWNSLSDDEKIAFTEKRFYGKGGHGKHHRKHGDKQGHKHTHETKGEKAAQPE